MSHQQIVIGLLDDLQKLKRKRREFGGRLKDPVAWGILRREIALQRFKILSELRAAGVVI